MLIALLILNALNAVIMRLFKTANAPTVIMVAQSVMERLAHHVCLGTQWLMASARNVQILCLTVASALTLKHVPSATALCLLCKLITLVLVQQVPSPSITTLQVYVIALPITINRMAPVETVKVLYLTVTHVRLPLSRLLASSSITVNLCSAQVAATITSWCHRITLVNPVQIYIPIVVAVAKQAHHV